MTKAPAPRYVEEQPERTLLSKVSCAGNRKVGASHTQPPALASKQNPEKHHPGKGRISARTNQPSLGKWSIRASDAHSAANRLRRGSTRATSTAAPDWIAGTEHVKTTSDTDGPVLFLGARGGLPRTCHEEPVPPRNVAQL